MWEGPCEARKRIYEQQNRYLILLSNQSKRNEDESFAYEVAADDACMKSNKWSESDAMIDKESDVLMVEKKVND
jgi:hypothetical protein